ncbi:MAG: hypothetical protein KC478_13335 [Bacteriovoracaceae bacterium]|nr:hypothetical protein [Bacteriovoracaceae bacterium]
MKDCLTIVPRKRNMSDKCLAEKYQAGLIPVIFYGDNVEEFCGFLLTREIDCSQIKEGEIFDLDYCGEILHAQYRSSLTKNVDGVRVEILRYEILNDEDFTEKRVPILTTGTALGEKKGAVVYQACNSLILRGKRSQLPDYIRIDITNLDINQKFFVSDLELTAGIYPKQTDAQRLIVECKFKHTSMTLLDAFSGGLYQEAV